MLLYNVGSRMYDLNTIGEYYIHIELVRIYVRINLYRKKMSESQERFCYVYSCDLDVNVQIKMLVYLILESFFYA